jgi:3'(2'), 5'-bisphosphate nucleotidase
VVMDYRTYLLKAIQAAIEAGEAILEVYGSDFTVEYKEDQSPLTLADRRSNHLIATRLKTVGLPILSEEGKGIDYDDRRHWHRLWVVDPLDGTKEFVKRNGEFTVNIALVERGRPMLGVILVPVKEILYFAASGVGAYKLEHASRLETPGEVVSLDGLMSKAQKLPLPGSKPSRLTIVGSRSHVTPELEAYVAEKRRLHGDIEYVSAGSSLKFCLVAEGRADIYPRLGPTMEWDTAAGQAIVENSGAQVLGYETNAPLTYNKENLYNPWYLVQRSK